eukprot:8468402-Lingulodinium_polyedra.AAC.1
MFLYRGAGDWHGRGITSVFTRVRGMMPISLRSGWAPLNRGEARAHQGECGDTAAWAIRYGPRLGFRPFSLEERSRATGAP